ncbi:hypothetical protein QTI66_05920 [Variovorax sp. J22R133]|uniref:hypothetical protein n=1 Tax=Variovorax brevis TaxID=3053503 RepID=UPI002578B380|nr:hypothetical protein [Variovorax sp. J22R133]MDM0111677.1 hypothetical protein [Variovorax sp. J22R133]
MRHVVVPCLLALMSVCWSPARAVDVLTTRNNLARTGVNDLESRLTPTNVDARSFGKLWTLYADGQVVAQPLYVSALRVDTSTNAAVPLVQGTFNAVVVATMHNTVYLYDADNERPGPQGRNAPLWAVWLGQPRPGGKDIDMWSTSDPEWGILGTPVIDDAKSVLYVVAWHDEGAGGFKYRLHALRLKDGSHVMPPVELQAPGLDTRHQKQRTGLALVQGVLYIGFGGDGSRGLLLAHDAATLQRRAVWSVTPTGRDGGLWQAGAAPAADAEGNLYLMTGNGTFDAASGGANYGDSFVKLRLEGGSIVVKDYFTPCNQAFLAAGDWDLGSSGPVLIPGADLVFGAGKHPHLFLLSTKRMGKYTPPPQPGSADCPNPNVLQDLGQAEHHHLHGSPVYWQGAGDPKIYLWRENELLHAYSFVRRRVVATPRLGVDALPKGMPGGMLSLSSLGRRNGILWAVAPFDGDANQWRGVRGVVRAIDAQDVTRTLWSSEQVSARDRLGLFAKYVPPTIADGKVFVATYGETEPLRLYGGAERPQQFPARYQVVVYGLLPPRPSETVDQVRQDVQLLRAETAALPPMDLARCAPADGGSLDCTDELARVAGAPAMERLLVPAGNTFAGCQLARMTVATNSAAMQTALAIGFYAADVTAGQFSADHGRRSPAADLKVSGQATLKGGQAATLHEFAGVVNCTLDASNRSELRFKPYIEFLGATPLKIFHNWDPTPGNHVLGGAVTRIDRSAEVLQ